MAAAAEEEAAAAEEAPAAEEAAAAGGCIKEDQMGATAEPAAAAWSSLGGGLRAWGARWEEGCGAGRSVLGGSCSGAMRSVGVASPVCFRTR